MSDEPRQVWRICREVHLPTAFTGFGAREYGGRWNSVGTPMVYCAGSLALAFLEVLVHVRSEFDLTDLRRLSIELPVDLIEMPAVSDLPPNWAADVPDAAAQRFGDRWVAECRSLALRVPTALMDHEWNYLLNPGHPAWSQLAIGQPETHPVDPRLRTRGSSERRLFQDMRLRVRGTERRIFSRRAVSGRVSGRRTNPSDTGEMPNLSFSLDDISVGGMRAQSHEMVEPGEHVVVFFPPQGNQVGWDAYGRVVRCLLKGHGYELL
ncbi:MAG: RES domain-containing protein [Planctomycetota bacterium]